MDFKQLIRNNYVFLLKRMDPSIELLGRLRQNEALWLKIASIKEQPVSEDKTDSLLSALLDVDDDLQDSSMNDVIDALEVSGQGHIANVFRQVTDEVSMCDEHYRRLQTKMAELAKCMDPENELLNQLQSAGVIGGSDVQRIRSADGRNEMTRKLIEILMKKPDSTFETLVRLLNEVGQTHVSYILTGEGNARPLSKKLRDKLVSNRVKLIRSIHFKSLVPALISRRVLTEYDQQHVESRQTENEKIERILDLIARKSQSAFYEFLAALIETKQDHAVVAMMGSEIAAKVHLITDTDAAGLCSTNLEEELREVMQDAFEKGEENGDLNDALGKSETCFTGVEEGSVIVKFRCRNVEALKKLHSSHRLDELFTQTFCSPLVHKGLKSIRLQIEERQFQQCADKCTVLKLMTSEHREALMSSAMFLVRKMTVSDDLLAKLPLSQECRRIIEAAATREDQVKTLLDVVSRQPDSAFSQLIDALRDTKQEQSALILGAPLIDLRDKESMTQQPAAAPKTTEDSMRHLVANLPAIDKETEKAISNVWTSLRAVRQTVYGRAVERTPRNETNAARSQQMDACRICNSVNMTEVARNDRVTLKVAPNLARISSEKNQHTVADNPSCMIDVLSSGERVYGVTSLHGNLFVLRADCIDVYIYSTNSQEGSGSYSHFDRMPLPGLQGHEWNDLTSSELHSCLCVADCAMQRVRAVELEGSVRDWNVPGSPHGISMTPSDDTLLVTCDDELVELGLPGGDWLRRVKLCSDIQRPLHAVKLTTGHYVVSHGCARGLLGQHRVCMVNSAGNVLRSYGGQSGAAVGQLDLPCHMSVHKGDFVFVADSGNNRVVLLSPVVQLVQQYVGSVSHPRRIHLQRDARRLYIGELGNRVVIIHLDNDCTPLYCPTIRLLANQSRSFQYSA